MDCRIATFSLFALLASTLGCATTGTTELKSSSLPDPQQKIRLLVAAADCEVHQSTNSSLPLAQQQEMRENARKSYELALAQSPKCEPALEGLAKLYVLMGDHDRAVAAYKKAIEAAPRDAHLRYDVGIYQARNKEWQNAIAAFRDASKLEPENHKYVKTLAFTLARAGFYEESLASFRSLGMTEAEAHYNLARMLHQVHEDELCRSHLEFALAKNPNLRDARDMQTQLDESEDTALVQPDETAETIRE